MATSAPSPSPSPSRRSPSGGGVAGEGGGSGDGGGGGNKAFRLFGAWVRGPPGDVDDVAKDQRGGGRLEAQREGEAQGEHCAAVAGAENSHHCNPAPRRRGPARRPKCKATPWTAEEHRRFLRGLVEKGRGKWAAIAKEYVKTRNGTQVASHAQKHFLRQEKAAGAAGFKPRGNGFFGLAAHHAEEDGGGNSGARAGGGSQGAGSGETAPPLPGPDPSPAPPPAPETPHRGPPSPLQRAPPPKGVAPAPPQPPGPSLLGGVRVAPLHLAPPHAAVPAAFGVINPCVAPWPASPWAPPLWVTTPYFPAHGQLHAAAPAPSLPAAAGLSHVVISGPRH